MYSSFRLLRYKHWIGYIIYIYVCTYINLVRIVFHYRYAKVYIKRSGHNRCMSVWYVKSDPYRSTSQNIPSRRGLRTIYRNTPKESIGNPHTLPRIFPYTYQMNIDIERSQRIYICEAIYVSTYTYVYIYVHMYMQIHAYVLNMYIERAPWRNNWRDACVCRHEGTLSHIYIHNACTTGECVIQACV
jgi:hypothetical protein